jgi:hypothetical protein
MSSALPGARHCSMIDSAFDATFETPILAGRWIHFCINLWRTRAEPVGLPALSPAVPFCEAVLRISDHLADFQNEVPLQEKQDGLLFLYAPCQGTRMLRHDHPAGKK